MNTRVVVELEKSEQFKFQALPEEDEIIFKTYIEESRHLQEISQMFQMLLFDLGQMHLQYEWMFNDRVFSQTAKDVDIYEINTLIRNAVSAARTLIESMEVFDKVYIDSDGRFKKNYISRAYDDHFSYRFVDFMRNYMQHGHVPVGVDGERIYFQLSEILDVTHMKINTSLRQSMEAVEQELFGYGETNATLAVVPMLYEYFLLVHVLVCEFYRYIKMYVIEHAANVLHIIEEHPEYTVMIQENPFVPVYFDKLGMVHGFSPEGDMESDIDASILFAEQKLHNYESNNGHLIFLQIRYCLENRMPEMHVIDDAVFSENLEELCKKVGSGIHHLSFDDYYGKMEMNAACRIFPYIQFEKEVRWNVPYEEVTVADFIRTFPEVKEYGLKAVANNVGGADDILQRMVQDWSVFLCETKMILGKLRIHSVVDVIDWLARIEFVYQNMKLFKQSFSKENKDKPCIRDLRKFILRKKTWKLSELEEQLNAHRNLLVIVLEGSGYVSDDNNIYVYDEAEARKIEQERLELKRRREDNHGTNVRCYEMNQAIEMLNVDLLYYVIVAKEADRLEDLDANIKDFLSPLEECNSFVRWDDQGKCVHIQDTLPEEFDEEVANRIWFLAKEASERVNAAIKRLEGIVLQTDLGGHTPKSL